MQRTVSTPSCPIRCVFAHYTPKNTLATLTSDVMKSSPLSGWLLVGLDAALAGLVYLISEHKQAVDQWTGLINFVTPFNCRSGALLSVAQWFPLGVGISGISSPEPLVSLPPSYLLLYLWSYFPDSLLSLQNPKDPPLTGLKMEDKRSGLEDVSSAQAVLVGALAPGVNVGILCVV